MAQPLDAREAKGCPGCVAQGSWDSSAEVSLFEEHDVGQGVCLQPVFRNSPDWARNWKRSPSQALWWADQARTSVKAG